MAGEEAAAAQPYATHPQLALTAQVMLQDEHKLLLGQGHCGDSGEKTRPDWDGKQPPTDGWHLANNTWVSASAVGWVCGLAYGKNAKYIPCLFNETADLREQTDLAPAHAATVARMWAALNTSVAGSFTSRSPAHLLGPCDQKCAEKHWKSLGSTSGAGPSCGVPGC